MEKVEFHLAYIPIELQAYLVYKGCDSVVPYRGNLKPYKFPHILHPCLFPSGSVKEGAPIYDVTALKPDNLVLRKARNRLFYAPCSHSTKVVGKEVNLCPRSRFYALGIAIYKALIDSPCIVYPFAL